MKKKHINCSINFLYFFSTHAYNVKHKFFLEEKELKKWNNNIFINVRKNICNNEKCVFLLQDLKNQIMTTNVWVEQVSLLSLFFFLVFVAFVDVTSNARYFRRHSKRAGQEISLRALRSTRLWLRVNGRILEYSKCRWHFLRESDYYEELP